ncbi:DUF4268 domain-containing protein [Nocardioides sp. GY 10127]|uniref:DUF4268 domain-containing protein n=1 Tax=Nocardioides sp. GY 10127 TaxID=2569762 RepID=UPI0010A87E79|nr:DUF4268 domain-containing protein [Nocardioides sp. GY 10127]TIC84433.1 DUF4268 domain-containing protein [Nocardioides sp. GY 10127]
MTNDGTAGHVPAVTISRLVPVSIKETWPTEPGGFTPWLLDHADLLSEALGIEVELTAKEHSVGPFSLDLIGQVAGSEDKVIVENQYGDTDHQHLGQVMTYAGGTDPKVVVWIAERFREQHRAALEWLNDITVPDVRFFGIAVSVVRMERGDDRLVAPRMELVVKPNDWEKIAKMEAASAAAGVTSPSSVQALYKRFWEQLEARLKAKQWTSATAPAQNWWSMPAGTTSMSWGISYATFGCRSELYFQHTDARVNSHRLSELERRQPALQEAFGPGTLLFDHVPGKTGARMEVRLEGPKIQDESSWGEVQGWMLDVQQRMRFAVSSTGGLPMTVPNDFE